MNSFEVAAVFLITLVAYMNVRACFIINTDRNVIHTRDYPMFSPPELFKDRLPVVFDSEQYPTNSIKPPLIYYGKEDELGPSPVSDVSSSNSTMRVVYPGYEGHTVLLYVPNMQEAHINSYASASSKTNWYEPITVSLQLSEALLLPIGWGIRNVGREPIKQVTFTTYQDSLANWVRHLYRRLMVSR